MREIVESLYFITLDSSVHWINPYPVDKYWGNQLRYQVDIVIHLSKSKHKILLMSNASKCIKVKFETFSLKNQYYFNSKVDEGQFSPNNTNTLSSEEVMRIDKMII